MLRLAYAVAAVLLLALALFPFPTPAPSHAEPSGAFDFYLAGVLQSSTGNATPTLEPTLTPTPSGEVTILDNDTWYFNEQLNSYFVVGEVVNDKNTPIELVNLLISFYNEAGTLVYSDRTFVKGVQLDARETSCFLLYADGLSVPWSRYEFSELTFYDYQDNVPDLLPQNVQGRVVPYSTYEEYELRGIVRNRSASDVPFVEMVGTLYNTQGEVVDCDFAWEYEIEPSTTESFEMEFNLRTVYSGIVDSLRVIGTGDFSAVRTRSSEAQTAYEAYLAEQEELSRLRGRE